MHCPVCGYNLRGLPDGNCPECGTPFERKTLARMDQPTVSIGAIRLFAFMWPAIFLLLIAPVALAIFVAVRLGLEALMDTELNEWFVPGLLYTALTFGLCWPVCKDMARQAARYKRLMDDSGEPVSTRLLFTVYMLIEFGAIILMTLFVLCWSIGLETGGVYMTSSKAPASEKYVYCPVCDYNLHGLPDGPCPECGTPFEREKLKRSRVGRKESYREVFGTLFAWPVMALVGVVPAIGITLVPLVMIVIVVLQSEHVAILLFSAVLLAISGTILFYTVVICRDLARQAHRINRARSPDGEHWSRFTLFWLFLLYELFGILLVPGVALGWFIIVSLS